MNKKEMIKALISHFSGDNKSRFAKLLDVSPQTISSWIKRESFDIERVYEKCEKISPHWLITGEGEMLLPEDKISVESKSIDDSLMHHLKEEIKKLKEENKELNQEVGFLKAQIEQFKINIK